MEYANITLCLGGEIAFQVEKEGVSVAEIALFRELHGGADAIRNVRPTVRTREPEHQAKARLLEKYQHSPGTVEAIERLWPGLSPRLPTRLADIGMEIDPATLDARARKPRGAERVRMAPAPDANDGDEGDEDPEADDDDGSGYEAEDAKRADDEDAAPAATAAALARGADLARAARAGKGG